MNNWFEDVQLNIVFGLLRLWTLEDVGMGPQVSDSEARVFSLVPYFSKKVINLCMCLFTPSILASGNSSPPQPLGQSLVPPF